jgi:hypothetical protein
MRVAGTYERDARACIRPKKVGREVARPTFTQRFANPPLTYGVGITAWVWFEFALSLPDPSTAVVT